MSIEPKPTSEASVGELLSQLSEQTSRLVRDEMRLAQKEFTESAKHAGVGAGLLSAAGLLSLFGLATLIAAAVAGLSEVVPVWAAALIVAAVLFIIAGIAGLFSKKEVEQASPTPERTVASVKQDIKEVQEARHDRT
ncbi:phage holin family protein [Mycobacterium sp. MYCO198283]|uniref:phage holin family protein n=1 Tax=Mycobacterium sp. MYCO198283 TaxID=2883505 RepID=UPI001E4F37D6|nr:phage holin family protein [Mycobacterium sp. MYCO198283]MCG5434422.1 phage holin family protein [Mycobacterium sp. MYCO198283]